MSTEYTTDVVDVVVVGGGFAGVTASRELAQAGYSVVLLEGKDRLGGRTHSIEWQGETIELGGTWIHYLQPFVWSEVVRAGSAIRSFGVADVAYFNSGSGPQALTDEEREETAAAWYAFLDGAREAMSEPFAVDGQHPAVAAIDAQTMKDRLDELGLKPAVHKRLSAGLTSWANGRIDNAGALFPHRLFAMCGFSVPALDACTTDLVLADGTGQLIVAMASQANFAVRFNTHVAGVRRHHDLVSVDTADGQAVVARAVVIALPLNVLGNLEFEPALPSPLAAAVSTRQSSTGCKVLIKASGRADRVDASAVEAAFAHVLTDRFFADGSQLLVAFGPDARVMESAGTEQVQNYLDAMVPGFTVEDFQWHDWTTDRYAQGTWAVHTPSWFSNHGAALDDPVDTVFFAGSDFAHGWVGHIDGAIESGVRTARHIQQSLGVTSRSPQSA